MKMRIERVKTPENELVFTIRVEQPHQIGVDQKYYELFNLLQKSSDTFSEFGVDLDGWSSARKHLSFRNDVILKRLQNEKLLLCEEFSKKQKNLIEQALNHPMKCMLIEIFNWITDNQPENFQKFINHDPKGRERFYFDNDPEKAPQLPQENDITVDEDEDEDSDEEE